MEDSVTDRSETPNPYYGRRKRFCDSSQISGSLFIKESKALNLRRVPFGSHYTMLDMPDFVACASKSF